ncbi:glycine receptor subunit alpha-2-like [Liolophura sinensis]|uniref:glycine receptor subunit alpha-2-like n=1 Tax=Liolophura sinensis TaxID=3198878 RepID=UPI003158E8E5
MDIKPNDSDRVIQRSVDTGEFVIKSIETSLQDWTESVDAECQIDCVTGENVTDEDTIAELMAEVMTANSYNKHKRPPPRSLPTILRVGFYVETLASISELDMEFTINIYLRQTWVDPRLAYISSLTAVMVDTSFLTHLWQPSLYFVNGKEEKSHNVPVPNKLAMLDPNGTVFYSQKLSLRLYCGMDLEKFPFDKQECPVKMMSYAYNSKGILLEWMKVKSPVEIKPNLELPEFIVAKTSLHNCSSTYITGRIHLKRRYLQYAIQIYVPSALMVILSWANFWIDHRSTPARVSLALLCILTITTQSSGAGSKLPKVAYVKAIDVWMSVCMVFVFSAFIEFTLVNIMARRVEGEKTPSLLQRAKNISGGAKNVVGVQSDGKCAEDKTLKAKPSMNILQMATARFAWRGLTGHNDNKIIPPLTLDSKSRVLFPFLFIAFNIIYWVYYLVLL